MKNRDLFVKDPLGWSILNEGVSSNNDLDLNKIRYELETFVCEGKYEEGLRQILTAYIDNFGSGEQKAAWVSGFYGSGKSHLVKILRYLWVDHKFSGGATARGLANLSDDVKEKLTELTTLAKRHHGLQAVGGTLTAGAGSVRLRLLGIVFRSLGLREEYPYAKFVLHLKADGNLDAFIKAVEKSSGKKFDAELTRLYSSKAIAEAYHVFYSHHGSPAAVSEMLRKQYPNVADVTIQEMLTTIRDALSVDGNLPCTVVVLDELQAFINNDADISNEVQEVTEACSKQLDGRVMFVGTGQSALSDTPALQKLMGRYRIGVHLQDNDVEKVVRTVVLQKKEARKTDILELVKKHEGEITRQLKDTKIGTVGEDSGAYVPDYPLLPVRLRFWERVLQSVDKTGTQGQLRTQLRVVHEACKECADRALGGIVPADFIYDQIATVLVQSGEMQKRFQEIIEDQKGKKEGVLRRRICSLAFLINKLPRETGMDIGIRSHAEHMADLLSEDLAAGSTELRAKIPGLLQKMVEEGVLMEISGEYYLQTTEGAAWEQEYRRRLAAALGDEPQLAAARGKSLFQAMQSQVGDVTVLHGSAKERRKLFPHFGAEAPPAVDGITVWIRDGWSEGETSVLNDIRKRNTDDPMLHVFIPKAHADELRGSLASFKAAEETLNYRGNPTTAEGREARQAMVTRQKIAEDRCSTLVSNIVSGARLFLSGGHELSVITLPEALQDAAQQVLARLYPQFGKADHGSWQTVLRKAKEGSPGALAAVGHAGDPDKHPVAIAIMNVMGTGKRGVDIRKQFTAPPYGWPQDAIDGTLATLLVSNHLIASFKGKPVTAADDQRTLGSAEYRLQIPVIPPAQRLKVRELYQLAGVPFTPGEEATAAPQFLACAKTIAAAAGGDAPAPNPPSVALLLELEGKSGNELLLALFDKREELKADLKAWKETAEQVQKRSPAFQLAASLQPYTAGMDKSGETANALQAIRDNRSLLESPDPVAPVLKALAKDLRQALTDAHETHTKCYAEQEKRLGLHPAWQKLTTEKQKSLLAAAGSDKRGSPAVASEQDILGSLQTCDLPTWRAHTDALPAQFDKALSAAVKELEPKAQRVVLPSATIHNKEELDIWLKEIQNKVETTLKEGPVII